MKIQKQREEETVDKELLDNDKLINNRHESNAKTGNQIPGISQCLNKKKKKKMRTKFLKMKTIKKKEKVIFKKTHKKIK